MVKFISNNVFKILYFRLLYTLAFKPSYLQQLLGHIKSEMTLFGSSELFAQGVHLGLAESKKIVPVLDVFCSLFSHLLVTLDDSEFFSDESSNNLLINRL